MKSLTNVKITVLDGKVTITGDIAEFTKSVPVQQVSVGHMAENNRNWPRHLQLSDEAFLVEAYGTAVAFPHDDMVKIAGAIEPKTVCPPMFTKSVDTLTAEVSSDIEPDLQWQVAEKLVREGREDKTVWADIPGATAKVLDKTLVKPGQAVRCIASSAAGRMISNPTLVR